MMMRFRSLVLFLFSVCTTPLLTTSTSIGSRIIGGEVARAGQFPYAASININTATSRIFCSGALIENEWILTTAQCVDGAVLFTIRLGSNSLTADESNVVRVSADLYFIHPGYDPLTLQNDVGLIKLRLPVPYSDYIQPINYIANWSLPVGTQVTTFGWGQVNDEDAGPVDRLNYVHLVTLSTDECRLTYGNQITDNMICVDGNYNEGICVGDIGSPLVLYGSRGYAYLVGISSFISGNGCESTDPSGFTKSDPYRNWIREVVTNNTVI